MLTFFKNKFFLLALALVAVSCLQEDIEDLPPVERQGNIFALFEPSKPLQLQAAITGYSLDRINSADSQRVVAKLFENNQLVESFNLTSSTTISWGAEYRLECLIDNEYAVEGQIKIPQDSLRISAGVTRPLVPPINVFTMSGRRIFLEYIRSFTINTPTSFAANQIYLSRGNPSDQPYFDTITFPNGVRTQVLNAGTTNNFEILLARENDPVRLVQMSSIYYEFVEEMRNPNVEQEVVPGNISVNNMSVGTGLMAFQFTYLR
jgi:hypothetical protein